MAYFSGTDATLESLRGHFGITLGSIWITLGSLGAHFGILWGHFGVTLSHFQGTWSHLSLTEMTFRYFVSTLGASFGI